MEGRAKLHDWIRFAVFAKSREGSVTFIHRAERREQLITDLEASGMGRIELLPLIPKAGSLYSSVVLEFEFPPALNPAVTAVPAACCLDLPVDKVAETLLQLEPFQYEVVVIPVDGVLFCVSSLTNNFKLGFSFIKFLYNFISALFKSIFPPRLFFFDEVLPHAPLFQDRNYP